MDRPICFQFSDLCSAFIPKQHPCGRINPSCRYKLLVLSWLVGILLLFAIIPFSVTFTLLRVYFCCLHETEC